MKMKMLLTTLVITIAMFLAWTSQEVFCLPKDPEVIYGKVEIGYIDDNIMAREDSTEDDKTYKYHTYPEAAYAEPLGKNSPNREYYPQPQY